MKTFLGIINVAALFVGACQQLPTEPTPIDLSQEQPIAVPDTAFTDEDLDVSVDVLVNDSSLVGDELELTDIELAPTEGEASIESGQIAYVPGPNFSGIDSLRYVVSGSVLSASASVMITVRPVNDPPVANDDEFQVNETAAFGKIQAELDVLANDTDIDGDRLSVLRTGEPSNGEVTIPAGGQTVIYTPNPDFVGTDTFRYTIQDGNQGLDAADVVVIVNASNDAPVANDNTYAVIEDSVRVVPVEIGVLSDDEDDEGDILEAILVQDVMHGMLELNSDGSFNYRPDAGFDEVDSFLYVASDGMSESNQATVTLNIVAVNDPPISLPDTFRVNEDAELNVTPPGVLGNDSDPEGGSLTVRLISGAAQGNLSLAPNGSLTYVGFPDFFGVDTFVYRATDGASESGDTEVVIEVAPVNDAPTATVDSYELTEDQALTVLAPGVLANDTDKDGDRLTSSLLSQPTSGSVTLETDGSFVYTPDSQFSGLDGFTYSASDGALSSVAAVSLRVMSSNDVPIANDDAYQTPANIVLEVTPPGVLSNDSDPEGDRITSEIVSEPVHGIALIGADGSLRYEPADGFVGDDVFTYEASDATLTSAPATVTVSVTAVGRPPIAADDLYSTSNDSVLVVDAPGLLGNDSDPDQDVLTVQIEGEISIGELNLMDDGSFEFDPPVDFTGIASFRYRATDGANVSNVALVQITVQD